MRSILVALMCAGAANACSQCAMTIDFGAGSNCGGLSWIVLGIANGMAPYDAQVHHGPLLVSSYTDVPAAMLSGSAPPGAYAAAYPGTTITVTDALGCVAQASAMTPAVHAVQPTLTASLDCSSGLTTVRCTGFTDLNDPGLPYVPCDWPGRTCSVDGVNMGPVSSSWVNEGGGVWRYSAVLTGGAHTFNFSGTNLPCNGALECWGSTQVNAATITPGDCGANLRLRAALGGALSSGTVMSDDLRAGNLLPLTEPFSGLGYTYVGSAAGLGLLPVLLSTTGNNAIVDWVLVELRSGPMTISWSKPALLQRDGDVIDLDGDTYLNFPVAAGSYHVALRHRNHLGVMTITPRALAADPAATLVDFRVSGTGTHGTNARVLKGTVWCLWPAEATGDGLVKYTGAGNDRDAVLSAVGGGTPTNTVNNVYDPKDVNLDGSIKYTGSANDRDVILQTIGGSVPTATRTQQLP